MKRNFATPAEPLLLPITEQGAPSSLWGDIPPAMVSESVATDLPLGPPLVSAVELVRQFVNHAVFGQPLPAPCNALPKTGSLLSEPAPRQWQPDRDWTTAASERSARYAAVYTRASLALQSAMREWIPSLYFDHASRLEDLELAQGMIGWRASRPAVGEHVDRLCCDVLDPGMMDRCLFWVERNIRPVLRTLLPVSAKLDAKRRGYFDPRGTKQILLRLRRAQRGFQMILRAEEDIITQLVKLAAATPQWRTKAQRQPRQTAIEVDRGVEKAMATVEARLRRILPHGDVDTLMRMLVIVLTNSFAEAQADSQNKAA
jgi:hypothetical protein